MEKKSAGRRRSGAGRAFRGQGVTVGEAQSWSVPEDDSFQDASHWYSLAAVLAGVGGPRRERFPEAPLVTGTTKSLIDQRRLLLLRFSS